ncbi:uncharacterized protein PHACADRAFT_164399 [Phanerochaete carnosa HHB-10118-sp]|uniref:Prefoldin subunit 3 n=1 Tax=Phanerochaete carnosa (strain HHB-10118-sp) TaxID=650164 RepID=K5VM05_PHACS|nr:uncharacterized protein PHACADRAFT_164399 [Phanerochaete carnosa HHB-10118-sp]EKM52463.1 hypothetical protein PHACADRAFT_164399 [Phanerochaete carnosa HHB-10118-sp]
MSMAAVEAQERNARGIPKAPFIADVAEFLGAEPKVEGALKEFQAALAKYRYMDHNLAQRRRSLEEKIPDIKKTLTMIEFLQERRVSEKKPLKTTFELNDTLYAEAELEDTDTVYLWLGANVMLSYKIPQAIALLKSKLEGAESNLANVIEDLEFLREQITVMEVNTARVYNWDVKRRRELREKEAREGGSLLKSKEES